MKRGVRFSARRGGKSWAQAKLAAEILRRGGRVSLVRFNEQGEMVVEPIVCVPGLPDGTQLPEPAGGDKVAPATLPPSHGTPPEQG